MQSKFEQNDKGILNNILLDMYKTSTFSLYFLLYYYIFILTFIINNRYKWNLVNYFYPKCLSIWIKDNWPTYEITLQKFRVSNKKKD